MLKHYRVISVSEAETLRQRSEASAPPAKSFKNADRDAMT